MERFSDEAIEIVNELHTERLAYDSEYVPIADALNQLKEYEDAEEQGLLLHLPCKVGDKIYLSSIGRHMEIVGYSLEKFTDLNSLYFRCKCVEHEKHMRNNSCNAMGVCPGCAFAEKCFQGFRLSDWEKIAFPTSEEAEKYKEVNK